MIVMQPVPPDQPTQPVARRIDVGSLTLNCLDYGEPAVPDPTPPVLMWHGQADSAWAMDSIAQALVTQHRVYSFDLRGHGRSDWGAYTLMHFVGDIAGAIETLGVERPIIIGHSLGGQAVAQFCGLFPETPAAAVLIESLGPPPHRSKVVDPDGFERAYARRVADIVRQPAVHRSFASLDLAIERFMKGHPQLDADRARTMVENATVAQDDGSVIWRFDPATRDWVAGHDHGRAEQRWRGITCPTQIVLAADAWDRFWRRRLVDADDRLGPISPEELDRRLGCFAGAERLDFHELADAGHMAHYDQPAALNTLITAFVDSLDF